MATLRERFDTFDVLVTILVFVQLVATVFLGTETHRIVRLLMGTCAVLFLVLWLTRRWYRVVRAIYDFVPNFSIDANRAVWKGALRQYRYLGVSGGTFEKDFALFVEKQGFPANCKIQFLLLRPFSDSVRRSKEHELSRKATDEELNSASRRIEESAKFYSGLRTRGADIEVRFADEYNGFWIHLLDDREAIVGFLMKGESNLEGPVLHLKRADSDNLLLRFYIDEFERQWDDAARQTSYSFAKGISRA